MDFINDFSPNRYTLIYRHLNSLYIYFDLAVSSWLKPFFFLQSANFYQKHGPSKRHSEYLSYSKLCSSSLSANRFRILKSTGNRGREIFENRRDLVKNCFHAYKKTPWEERKKQISCASNDWDKIFLLWL